MEVKMANKRVEFWLETLNYFVDDIKELGERYPDKMRKVNDYMNVIDDIYNHDKQGVIGESIGAKIERVVEEKMKDKKFRREHPDAFGGPVDLMCDDPLYDGESVF